MLTLRPRGDDRSVMPLIAELDRQPSSGVAAIEVPGAGGSARAVARLVERLTDD